MSQYLLLIHEDEEAFEAAPESVQEAHFALHRAFQVKHRDRIQGSKALDSTTKAKYLRKTPGGYVVTDGVYAETKEALGGYYVIEAADLDEALAVAGDLPGFGDSAVIQVRPIWAGQ